MDIIDDFQKTYSNKKIQNFTLDDYPNFARLGKYKKKDDKYQNKPKPSISTPVIENHYKEESIVEITEPAEQQESFEKQKWSEKAERNADRTERTERTLRNSSKRKIEFKKVIPPRKQPKKDLKITIPAKNKSLEYPMKIIKILNDMSNQDQEHKDSEGPASLSQNNEEHVFSPEDPQKLSQNHYESPEYIMKKHIEGTDQSHLDNKNDMISEIDSIQQGIIGQDVMGQSIRDLKVEINKNNMFNKPHLISGGYSYGNNYNQTSELKSPYSSELFSFISPNSNDLLSNLQNGGTNNGYYRPNYAMQPNSNPYSGQVPQPYYNYLAGNSAAGNQGPSMPEKYLFEEDPNYLQVLEGTNDDSTKNCKM